MVGVLTLVATAVRITKLLEQGGRDESIKPLDVDTLDHTLLDLGA